MSKPPRCVLRLPGGLIDRLDAIAAAASVTLQCDVSRAAVVRAALTAWLAAAETSNLEPIAEPIRAARLTRGRKPAGAAPHRVSVAPHQEIS